MRLYLRIHTPTGPRTVVMQGMTAESASIVATAISERAGDGALVTDDGPAFTWKSWKSKQDRLAAMRAGKQAKAAAAQANPSNVTKLFTKKAKA